MPSPSPGAATQPQRNRVTPTGEIVAIPLRGAWTGNRGIIHRDREIVRRWASHHWLICTLSHRDWWHEQWLPHQLTWLFFHDEAVALAAGHRPCARCRRDDYNAYRELLARSEGSPRLSADALDCRLHTERLQPDERARRLHQRPWTSLPDGAFVVHDGRPALVNRMHLVPWSPGGYATGRRRPRRGDADVLTPPASVAVLAAGYEVQLDAACRC